MHFSSNSRFLLKKTISYFILSALSMFGFSPKSFSSACCGGGSGVPGIIVGDERANLGLEFSSSRILTDVGQDKIWRDRNEVDSTSTFRLQYSHIFLDRFQAGISSSMIRRDRAGAASSGLGDISAHIGYEVLPEWDFSQWRPRAVSYFGLTAPSGKSIYEASELYLLDSRGKGFWSAKLGTAFTKVLGRTSLLLNLELARTFARPIETPSFIGVIEPQTIASLVFGAGYSIGSWTVSSSLSHLFESELRFAGTPSSQSARSQVTTFSFGVDSPIGNEDENGDRWFLRGDYFDQRLFGAPENTALTNGISISLRRNFSR